jgi:metal-responsive CopG/Arc/MetJ family transcriptional regulator
MKKEETRPISIRIPVRLLEEAEIISQKRRISQADVIRQCLDVGIECHKEMEKLGLIGIVDLVYYARQSLRATSAGKQLHLPL